MGPIVCATRGGEAGRRTQERAIALAKERGAALLFLAVFNPGFTGTLNPDLLAAIGEEQQWLGRASMSVAQARARQQGIEAGAVVLSGEVLESIEEFLCASGASTLVIGEARTTSALSTFRPGRVQSCSRHVEENTDVEVVVVTAEDDPAEYRTELLGSDDSLRQILGI